MAKRVVITGYGVVSPIGNDVHSFWDSLTSSKSGVSKITLFDSSKLASQIAGEVKDFDPSLILSPKEIRKTPRFVQFALKAAQEAVEASGIDFSAMDPYRAGTVIGSGIGSLQVVEREHSNMLTKGPNRISPFLIPMLITNEAAGNVAIKYHLQGVNFCTVTACASGAHAIGEAFHHIKSGNTEVMIAGGTEACITVMGVGGFCALKALSTRNNEPERASRPFDLERDGFVMSEGCGIVVLEELEHAQKRGAPIIAELCGYGATCDAYHITAPDPTGQSAAKAMEFALEEGGLSPEQVDYINTHGTSTKLNDKMETQAIKSLFKEKVKKVAISSTKSMTGHMLGAAGAVEFIACCLAIQNNMIPPTINYENPDPECDLDYTPNKCRERNVDVALTNSLGFGGHNASLLIKKFK